MMPTTHDPHEHPASSNEGRGDATISAAEWIGIARSGFSNQGSPEAMLWDDLDLDDPDDRRFGDYDLLERIGRGGMGVVFRAHQFSLGREVALKFIVGGLASNTRAVAQFLAEARAAARLHHPHIVPVFEVGTVDGMHFFSMPLLRGQTLAERIAIAPMSQKGSVNLLLKLGAAVEYAHSLGLLHLDLKPANVLFDEHAQPLIGDFGLARHMDETGGVDAQEVSGTPAYMAPEQIEIRQIETGQIDPGKGEAGMHRLDERTDVYALGAILFELLTGAAPHRQEDARTLGSAITGDSPLRADPIARLRPGPKTLDRPAVDPSAFDRLSVDKDLAAICMTCLQRDPQARYQRVADLNADLARYRDGNTVSVRQPRWRERVARSLQRNPAITLAISFAIAALIVGLATTTWQWRRADRERVEANRQQQLANAQAARMQQLAGFMAAAFPDGDALSDGHSDSARAAVSWLKKHAAGDPSMQRAVLTSFREALVNAHKSEAVTALVNEIVDQLGEDYREQQVERLARKGDRDDLVAAALVGMPRGGDGLSSPAHADVLRRLFADHSDDPLALYVVALACHRQATPCAHPEYFARLTERFPHNAVHWVLFPNGAKPTQAAIAANVMHAANATYFDDRLAAFSVLLRAALRDQQVPQSILQPLQAIVQESEVAPSLRRNAVDNMPLPIYGDFLRVCKPDNDTMRAIAGLRDDCSKFATMGMHSPGASILARMISSAMLRRLHKGTPIETEAKEYRREYVWLGEHAESANTFNSPSGSDQLQKDIAQYGEWEAWQRQAERSGVSRTPPPGWVPKNPMALLLSEERTPKAAK